MANATREYLSHLARTIADVREATVIATNDDGSYTVEFIDSKARILARPANPFDFFKVNSRVQVQLASASGNVIGQMGTIVTRSPQRGLSDTVPVEKTQTFLRPMVIAIDPDPLVLDAGGDAGTQTIIGRGFTGPAEYVPAVGEEAEPIITDVEDPEVATPRVVMHVQAEEDSPLGWFDLLIAGIRRKRALRIKALPPSLAPVHAILIAGVYTPDNVDFSPVLWALDRDTLEVLGSFERGPFADDDYTGGPIATDGDFAYLYSSNHNDAAGVTRINLRTMTDSGTISAGADPLLIQADYGRMLIHEGELLLPAVQTSDGVSALWTMPLFSSATTLRYNFGTPGATPGAIGFDGTGGILVTQFHGSVFRIDPATWTQTAANAGVKGIGFVRERAWSEGEGYGAMLPYLWIGGTGANAHHVYRLNIGDLSTANDIVIAGSGPMHFDQPAQLRDCVFFIGQDQHLYRLKIGTTADLGALDTPAALQELRAYDDSLIIIGTDFIVRKLDFEGNVIAESEPLPFGSAPVDVDLSDLLIV